MSTRPVAVLGLGLIGGSIGSRLRRNGYRVNGFDAIENHARRALERGLVDVAAPSLDEAVRDADVVVLAAPVGAIVSMLPTVDDSSRDDALIIDVGSVKRLVILAMEGLPGAGRMVGGHPLAGGERSGPDVASPDLFEEKPFILCPTAQTYPHVLDRAREFVLSLGAVPVVLDAAEHDQALARTSHLPQVLSSALALSLDEGDIALSGAGLRDMTRLAHSDPIIWRDILMSNGDDVVIAIHRCMAHLGRLAALIDNEDAVGIAQFMESGRARIGGHG